MLANRMESLLAACPLTTIAVSTYDSRRRLWRTVWMRRSRELTSIRFPNRVSYGDRLTCCDALCLTRCHLASVSDSCHFFRTSQTCTCDGYTSYSCRRAHACSSGTVFVTVTVRAARCRKRPRSRENMVAANADALVRLTRAVLPAISSTPLRYPLPFWSPTTATAIADRPARANSSQSRIRPEASVNRRRYSHVVCSTDLGTGSRGGLHDRKRHEQRRQLGV